MRSAALVHVPRRDGAGAREGSASKFSWILWISPDGPNILICQMVGVDSANTTNDELSTEVSLSHLGLCTRGRGYRTIALP